MKAIDHNTITDAALEQMSGTSDPRLKQIMVLLCAICTSSRGRWT
jgi:hypothetical protein